MKRERAGQRRFAGPIAVARCWLRLRWSEDEGAGRLAGIRGRFLAGNLEAVVEEQGARVEEARFLQLSSKSAQTPPKLPKTRGRNPKFCDGY
eukprot:2860408-Rhodomonas_salina.1